MNDLSSLVDLERFTGLSELEREAAKTSFHMSVCRDPVWECPMCAAELKSIRRVAQAVREAIREELLSELSAAGRLLPEGAKSVTEFEVAWWGPGDTWRDVWGCDTEAHARKAAAATPPSGAVRGEIRSRDTWVGQWAVVEPVAVEGASE